MQGVKPSSRRMRLPSLSQPACRASRSDLVDDSGRLNEVRLALRTEGVSTLSRAGMAITLLRQGKMNPLEVFGGETIEGHDALVKMIEAAHAAAKE